MIFIFGHKVKLIQRTMEPIICRNCGADHQRAYVLQRYVHIFWIPVIPLMKTGILQCGECTQAVAKKDFSGFEKVGMKVAYRKAKTPLYYYTGLFLIVVFVGLDIYGKSNSARAETSMKSATSASR